MSEKNLISRLAQLARLRLTPEEETAFSQQIPKILEYVEQLRHVEASSTPPSRTIPAPLRADQAQPFDQIPEILSQAPLSSGRFWKVPPVK